MSQFLSNTSKRTKARKAGHADRLARRWQGHVPPIEVWRAGAADADTLQPQRSPGDSAVGDLPSDTDSSESGSTSSHST